jgi:hypothetical protein
MPMHTSATPYSAAPPPPPDKMLSSSHPFACLPEDWTTAVDPTDGHIYYYNNSTGQRSVRHPSAPPQDRNNNNNNSTNKNMGSNRGLGMNMNMGGNRNNNRNLQQQQLPPPPYPDNSGGNWNEHPSHATRRPDNHQCYCFFALCLCPPVGILALYHSIQVDRCWDQGLYGDAVNHGRQAPKYACLGTLVGVIFWIYLLFIRGNDWEWPDWDFGGD